MKRVLFFICLLLPMSAFGNVTFYGQCNYKGPGVTLNVGEYTADALRQVGIPEDAIASVKVSKGFTVTLFENDDFRGRYGTLKSSDVCLEDDGFSKIVSSLAIKPEAASKPKATFGKLNPALQPRKPQLATNDAVTVYADCDYKGVSARLTVGDYNLAQLKKFGLGNNEISSVRVPQGLNLSVYENDFLRGAVGSAKGDIPCLDSGAFGGKITSVSVVAAEGSLANNTAAPATTTQAAGGAAAMVFTECSFAGNSAKLSAGEYTNAQLNALGIDNNSISSIQLADGYEIELFLNDFYRGKNGVLGKNNPCIVGDYGDAVSSLIVRKKESTAASKGFAAPVATVYLHCNYRGESAELTAGRHTEKQLSALRIDSDSVSSIKVTKGYQAVIFDGPGFNGKSATIVGDDDCLDDNDINEKMSSIIIEPINAAKNNAGATTNNGNFITKSAPSTLNESDALVEGLQCVQDYVEKDLCDEARWTVIERRCGLAKVKELSDGYLQGHIKAGNCNAELWNELVRRTANPHLR